MLKVVYSLPGPVSGQRDNQRRATDIPEGSPPSGCATCAGACLFLVKYSSAMLRASPCINTGQNKSLWRQSRYATQLETLCLILSHVGVAAACPGVEVFPLPSQLSDMADLLRGW